MRNRSQFSRRHLTNAAHLEAQRKRELRCAEKKAREAAALERTKARRRAWQDAPFRED